MKFNLTIIAPAISMAVLSASCAAQTPSYRDACRIEPDGRATGASADICAQIARRWALLLPTRPIPGLIRIAKQPAYAGTSAQSGWVLDVPASDSNPGDPKYRKSDGLLRYYAEDVIPHEAGHQVFKSWLGKLNGSSAAEHYGSIAPDWFDEAPAVWMESQGSRQLQMKAVLNTKPSLAELVTMTHPGHEFARDKARSAAFHNYQRIVMPPCARCTWLADSLRKKYRILDYRLDGRGRADTVVWYSDRNPNKDDTIAQRGFYPLSYSLLRFIRLRGGTAAVQELVARYRENPTPRVGVLAALPGLPASVSALERAWHEFLSNPPPEDR